MQGTEEELYIAVVVGSSDITCILRDESFTAWLEVGELGWKEMFLGSCLPVFQTPDAMSCTRHT